MHVSIAYACQEYKTGMAEISGPVIPLTLFSTKSMCRAQLVDSIYVRIMSTLLMSCITLPVTILVL